MKANISPLFHLLYNLFLGQLFSPGFSIILGTLTGILPTHQVGLPGIQGFLQVLVFPDQHGQLLETQSVLLDQLGDAGLLGCYLALKREKSVDGKDTWLKSFTDD